MHDLNEKKLDVKMHLCIEILATIVILTKGRRQNLNWPEITVGRP